MKRFIKLSKWLAQQKNLPEEILCNVIDETEKAVKVEYFTVATVWLPKSQIQLSEEEKKES